MAHDGVVISFGAADGGAVCAGWLRDQLHARLAIPKDLIYFDTLTLLDKPETNPVRKGETSGAIAPLNPFWQLYYKEAMGKAEWMIFIITKEWLASRYCQYEFEWFLAHLKNQNKLKGMAIFLDDLHLQKHISNKFGEIKTKIPGKRNYLLSGEQRAKISSGYEKQWILDEASLTAIIKIMT